MQNSGISWTEHTLNALRGCTRVSPGCENCYAEAVTARWSGKGQWGEGLAKMVDGKPRWTGKVSFHIHKLQEAVRKTKPSLYFTNSISDIFHKDVPDEWIDHHFASFLLAPHHTFQVLTKRADRMRDYMNDAETPIRIAQVLHGFPWYETKWFDDACYDGRIIRHVEGEDEHGVPSHVIWPLPNVWLGVTAEDQKRADERIPFLLDSPAAVRWVSIEPQVGMVDLNDYFAKGQTIHLSASVAGMLRNKAFNCFEEDGKHIPPKEAEAMLKMARNRGDKFVPTTSACKEFSAQTGCPGHKNVGVDWIVVGGESTQGNEAREFHIEWAYDLLNQCKQAGVPFFFKQVGSNPVEKGVSRKGDFTGPGKKPKEWVEDLRVQEYPVEL